MSKLPPSLRSLARTPLVTAVAVLSLALGIGANAAIFSLFEQTLLRSLPVVEPQRLVQLEAPGPKSGSQSSSTSGGVEAIFSYPMFRDLEREQEVFTGLAAHSPFGANLAFDGTTATADGLLVSGSYFPVLGLAPTAGRLFTEADDLTPGAHPLVVLSHSCWQSRFNGDDGVVGRKLVVNGVPMSILGVAAAGFRGTTMGQDSELFVPISMREQMIPGWKGLDDRRSYWAYLFGRLRPGVGLEQAASSLNVPYRNILREIEVPLQEGMSESTLGRFAGKEIVVKPGQRGQSELHAELRPPMLLLLGVSALVLLIACANIANLLLVKTARRAGEIAVRLSLGARRSHLLGQFLSESLALAVLGSGLGYLMARATLRLISSLLPSESSLLLEVDFGATAWLFLAALTLITALVGLVPALYGGRTDLVSWLKGQAAASSGSRGAQRLRAVMVTAQIGLSMALLVSAGLFARSLVNVSRVDLGIDVEQLATFRLAPDLSNYSPAQAQALFQRIEEEVGALPGVRSVAASMVPLISGSNWGAGVSVEGFEAGPDTDNHSRFNEVGPGFLRTLGIPLLSGREFTLGDDREAPKVAVVNQAFAHKFGLGEEAVGRRMQVGVGGELDIEIVGLAGDAGYSDVKQAAMPVFYLPYRQDEELGQISFYVRAAGEPQALLASLREAVARLDPSLPLDDVRTMALQVRDNVYLDRLLTALSVAFATLATLLAAVGLYGVMAFSVAQRSREIGLRMALGADAGRVRRMILRQVGRLTLIGGVLGIAVALAIGRVAGSLLFGLEASDPLVLALAAALLGLVALGAGLLPANRAARVDPVTALHEQ